jgi:protein dithiol oxidoreductase (disulfide-forming)
MTRMRVRLELLLLALALGGCSHPSNPSAQRGSGTTAPHASAPQTAAASGGSSPSTMDLAAAANTQQEGADTGTATDSSEAALERIAALPAEGQLPSGPWVAGKNYDVLSPAQPTDVPAGKVEVIEFFWFACPHCYALDPTVETWRKDKPAYIDFRRVPVTWYEEHRAHARLFYTLQALGKLDELHGKVLNAIHQQGNLLYVPGDAQATLAKQVQFAKANGIAESDFISAYNSPAVQSSVQHGEDLARRDRIDSVPTFVINGKYVTDADMAGDRTKLMQLIDDLAASEKHH